ncbi:MAG: Serine/threonine-protein kinase PknD [Bryobacteraceae bacterium]|nr:Serine/threonine-protein kinase PknD [Bryobacteraceae bacterium]
MSNLLNQSLGRYHILEQLGEGGMATVYKAYDTRLETDVAVKVIRTENLAPSVLERALKRFEREAKALARLTHPNIVKVTDYGEHEGKPYLVMVYLPGGTLKQRLGKPIPWQEAARLLLPIAEALDFAHSQNMIHRDVKPSNILLTERGQPMLTDFGIAKILDLEETQDLTGTGVGVGTPEYMAPEQWTGKASALSDQYSLGVVLYEMLTGRKPYTADTPAAILLKQATEPLPRPGQFARDLPEKVEKILLKALAKNPEDRYPSMGGFAAALESALSGTTAAARPQPARPGGQKGDTQATIVQEGTTLREAPASALPFSPDIPKTAGQKEAARGKTTSVLPPKSTGEVNWRKWIPIGLLVVLLGAALSIGNGLLGLGKQGIGPLGGLATSTATQTPTPTATATNTTTPTATFTPTPGIGSTWTRPKDGMAMMFVPAGAFTMGNTVEQALADCQKVRADCQKNWFSDEEPPHLVELDSYWMDQTEVTNAMYALCVKAGICIPPQQKNSSTHDDYYGNSVYDNFPVIHVNWGQANTYCEWAGGRLPTEAEWEKAARGMDGRVYPWGDTPPTCSLTNFDPYSGNACKGDTTEAGSYENGKSPYGIYDMAGNVWEWVADWYDSSYYSTSPSNNPQGPASGEYRAVRGGSWGNDGYGLRSADRNGRDPSNSNDVLGFRCALSP